MGKKSGPRPGANPFLDAAHDIATGRAAALGAVRNPRPRVTVREVRDAANRIALILGVAYEELSKLQATIGRAEVDPPTLPKIRTRSMTAAELAGRRDWGRAIDAE